MLNRSLALTRQMHRESPTSQIESWQQPGLVARIALTLLAIPLERRLPHLLRRSIRRWFVRWFLYQVSVTAVTRRLGCNSVFGFPLPGQAKFLLPKFFVWTSPTHAIFSH